MDQKDYRPGLTTARIEAFSDGVFAIAITLLILGVAVPMLSPAEIHEGKLLDAVFALWPKILSFVISFLVIGIFWMGHHIMFQYIRRADRELIWQNMLLLMVISFFPFPASLIGEYGMDMTAVVLYGATLFLGGFFFSLIWHHATMNRRLVSANLNPEIISLGRKVILLAPITYGLAVLLAFVNPIISVIIYIVVPLLYILPSPVDKLIHYANEENNKN